jgi:hemerythrin-like metal-binding protein
MYFIEWDQSLLINIDEIDSQHKGLIEMINFLESCAKAPDRHKICFEIVLKLKNYFNEHFMTEEKHMNEQGYPELVMHKKEHNEFVKAVLDFEMACVEFYSPYTPMLDFLKEWFTNHIKNTDMKMGVFLKEKGNF